MHIDWRELVIQYLITFVIGLPLYAWIGMLFSLNDHHRAVRFVVGVTIYWIVGYTVQQWRGKRWIIPKNP